MEVLLNYIKTHSLKTPIKLQISLEKIANKNSHTGNQSRYLKLFIDKEDVTSMVANCLGNKLSKGKMSDCLIVHGSGSDMGFEVQYSLYRKFKDAGYPEIFDKNDYIYLGKNKRPE